MKCIDELIKLIKEILDLNEEADGMGISLMLKYHLYNKNKVMLEKYMYVCKELNFLIEKDLEEDIEKFLLNQSKFN